MRLTPLQSRGAQLSEEEIDDMIARTLQEERQIEARAALPAIASQDELSGQSGRTARREARQQEAAEARLQAVSAAHAPKPQVEDLSRPPRRTMRSFVPRLWSGALVGCALAVIWIWPWVIAVALIGAILLPVIRAIALGSDGVASLLARLYRWRHARHPERAERMRARIDQFAVWTDGILDRLPEGWTTGLYMPDFSREALLPDAAGEAPDPFDRLRAEANGA